MTGAFDCLQQATNDQSWKHSMMPTLLRLEDLPAFCGLAVLRKWRNMHMLLRYVIKDLVFFLFFLLLRLQVYIFPSFGGLGGVDAQTDL